MDRTMAEDPVTPTAQEYLSAAEILLDYSGCNDCIVSDAGHESECFSAKYGRLLTSAATLTAQLAERDTALADIAQKLRLLTATAESLALRAATAEINLDKVVDAGIVQFERAETGKAQLSAIAGLRAYQMHHGNGQTAEAFLKSDVLALAAPPVTETSEPLADTLMNELGIFAAKLVTAQRDLPADAARLLRENLWDLYDSISPDAPATPAKEQA